uniref:Uncharacterized protein n=1 Tax=Sphenodon punctatus TaxID=8508 RepID=A0A8D0GRP5_SPHPU
LITEKQEGSENQTLSFSVLPPRVSSVHGLENGVNKYTGKKGLFGISHQSVYRAQESNQEITLAPITQSLFDHVSPTLKTSATHKYIYKTIQGDDVIPQEELIPQLKNKFSNIARLLEWMIRWSDKRLLCDSTKTESCRECRPMMHVKTSASAILTSLWLLEKPYCHESQARNTKFTNRGKHCIVAPTSF